MRGADRALRKHQLFISNFADTYYIYNGPLVFMAAMALLGVGETLVAAADRLAEHVLPPFAGDLQFSRPYRQRDA